MLDEFLMEAGLQSKQIMIYRVVVHHAKASAAFVAQYLSRERTSTYKMMKQMVSDGFLKMTRERGTTFFVATSLEVIYQQFLQRYEQMNHLYKSYDAVQHEYQALVASDDHTTSVTLSS